jgi:opacity protein-like surface antigen
MPVHRSLPRWYLLACALGCTAVSVVRGQSPSSRFEVGGQFSDIKLIDTSGNASFSPGFGGRFDWNITPRIALDTQIDFFPRSYLPSPQQGGHTLQVLAGLRGRFVQRRRFAVYGLVRPGFTYASRAITSFTATTSASPPPAFLITPNFGGATYFTLDLGGGVEFYPSDRWILRAEVEASPYFVGNTAVNYTSPPTPEGLRVASSPGTVTDTWRVSTGMSYRPGEVQPRGGTEGARPERFEVGVQFNSLNFTWINGVDHSSTELGVGLFGSYNIWQFVYLDASLNFFPKDEDTGGPNDGGRILQGFFGTKEGFQVQRFGFFAKVRPGFMSYSRTLTGVSLTGPMSFRYARASDFALDVGGVVEYYWTRRAVLRFDVGDTVLYNSPRPFDFNGMVSYPPVPGRRNSLQIGIGFAIRF